MPEEFVSLRDYTDYAIAAMGDRLAAAVAALEAKVDAANRGQRLEVDRAMAANDRRLDAMNEFRGTVEDILSKALPREIFDERKETEDKRFDAIGAQVAAMERALSAQLASVDKALWARITEMEKHTASAAGQTRGIVLAIGIAFTVLQLLLQFWRAQP